MRARTWIWQSGLGLLCLAGGGCNDLLGLNDYHQSERSDAGASNNAGSSGAGGTSAVGGGAGAPDSGDSGGAAGSGMGGGSGSGTDAGGAGGASGGSGGSGGGLPESCGNQKLDPGETAPDCGGPTCLACDLDLVCLGDSDCLSRNCNASQLCAAPACNDNKLDGSESDVDCGGDCGPCPQGASCLADPDCVTGYCTNGVCCGVRCAETCHRCEAGTGACAPLLGDDNDQFCPGASNECVAGGVCSQCVNASPDLTGPAAETDRDCGGPVCAPCADGAQCLIADDCVSGVCSQGTCSPPTCSNDLQDGWESDVDCGGVCPSPCGVGEGCRIKSDCASRACTGGVCVP